MTRCCRRDSTKPCVTTAATATTTTIAITIIITIIMTITITVTIIIAITVISITTPLRYIVHAVVQTSSPSSPSSPPFNFQNKFSVVNEYQDMPSLPLSISNPSVGDEYHVHWCVLLC